MSWMWTDGTWSCITSWTHSYSMGCTWVSTIWLEPKIHFQEWEMRFFASFTVTWSNLFEHYLYQKPCKDLGDVEIKGTVFCPREKECITGLAGSNTGRDEENAMTSRKVGGVGRGMESTGQGFSAQTLALALADLVGTEVPVLYVTPVFSECLQWSFMFYFRYFQHMAQLTLVWMAALPSSENMQIDNTFFALTGLCQSWCRGQFLPVPYLPLTLWTFCRLNCVQLGVLCPFPK